MIGRGSGWMFSEKQRRRPCLISGRARTERATKPCLGRTEKPLHFIKSKRGSLFYSNR